MTSSPTNDQTAKWIEACLHHLEHHENASADDPMTNSVHKLAYELFDGLLKGETSHEILVAGATQLSDDAVVARAERFAQTHTQTPSWSALAKDILSPLKGIAFDTARHDIERTRAGIVFTAHPTFAMSTSLRKAVAAFASSSTDADKKKAIAAIHDAPNAPDDEITLSDEHAATQHAILRAQDALRAITQEILLWAREHHPDKWTSLCPAPISLATWVGYDLDGRTDIHWGESFRIRLEEKAMQLERYSEALSKIELADLNPKRDALAASFSAAASLASEQAVLFQGDLDDPDIVVTAANKLTSDDPRKLVGLSGPTGIIGKLISDTDNDETRLALCVLRAEMTNYGLGVGRIHLRVNAAQVRSALRVDLEMDHAAEFIDRSTLTLAAEKYANTKIHRINTASIFMEQMTARRQLMLCAQFLKHIDAKTPIRFLIAETEAPATVMGAVYLAKLYGVDHCLDISPLFETPEAIDRGGRFIERLLAEPEFVEYIRARKRLAIQIGFSDAGRFMGQISANLAIERIQILTARAMAKHDLQDVEVLIFNTHGDSMGRGAFPGSLNDRFNYLISPWTRARFDHHDLKLNAECSFQGGDGFLHFETEQLAHATVSALLQWSFTTPTADPKDQFYSDINYSWDFYRSVKSWQEDLFDNPDYHVAIVAFAPNLLFTTGSRKARRQSGNALTGPKSLRAIPHNAILQQLAAPAHIFGGIGATVGTEGDRLLDHIQGSTRMEEVIAMARAARHMTSLPALRAYGTLYDASFWAAKAANEHNPDTIGFCTEVARRLADLKIPTAINRYANLLAADLSGLDKILRELDGDKASEKRYEDRRSLHALHAIRQAMIMHAFMLVASLPPFSRRHDVSRKTIFDLAFQLNFTDLANLLDEIFPASLSGASALSGVNEPRDDDNEDLHGYPEVQRSIIKPLREIHQAIREIGIGIAHHYNAYG